ARPGRTSGGQRRSALPAGPSDLLGGLPPRRSGLLTSLTLTSDLPMTATAHSLAAALARLLRRSAASLQGRGEYADALMLHDRAIAMCRDLLAQGVIALWPAFAASLSDRVRALSALGRQGEAAEAERDALLAVTPEAPVRACELVAELLLARTGAEPRDRASVCLAIVLLDRLPAGSSLRRQLSDRLLR